MEAFVKQPNLKSMSFFTPFLKVSLFLYLILIAQIIIHLDFLNLVIANNKSLLFQTSPYHCQPPLNVETVSWDSFHLKLSYLACFLCLSSILFLVFKTSKQF